MQISNNAFIENIDKKVTTNPFKRSENKQDG